MKFSDIERLQEAGLITVEQRDRIVAHYNLKEDGGRFLAILSVIGALLIASGVVLLISANWEEIPRGVKIAVGLALMLGAHGAGWYLREAGRFPKTGEALHLMGSLLFLGNIALVGQIYHLSSRPPNALLLWWVGIAALPWLLRSKAQHVLSLIAFGVWFGFEVNQSGSWVHMDGEEQLFSYSLLGLVYVGLGYCLRRSSFHEFAGATERLGLLGMLAFAYPLTWGIMGYRRWDAEMSIWIFPALAVLAALLIGAGLRGDRDLTPQWRWTWGGALAGWIGIQAVGMYAAPEEGGYDYWFNMWFPWLTTGALFILSLLQVQVGLQRRSSFEVNVGVTAIGLVILAAYIRVFSTMAHTGLVFVVSGVFLIGLGIYLENKRRALVRQIRIQPATGGGL